MYGPLKFSRSDLVSLTIQSGRDNGLPSYKQARAAFDLPPVSQWEDINPQLKTTNPRVCGWRRVHCFLLICFISLTFQAYNLISDAR